MRRCLGASFALFEMRVVLQTVFERLEALFPSLAHSKEELERTADLAAAAARAV